MDTLFIWRKPIYPDILCTWNKIIYKVFCTVIFTSTLKESKTNDLEPVVHAHFFFVDFLCWVNIFVVIHCHSELIWCYYTSPMILLRIHVFFYLFLLSFLINISLNICYEFSYFCNLIIIYAAEQIYNSEVQEMTCYYFS